MGTGARPGIGFRTVHKLRAHGVAFDIAADSQQVLVGLNGEGVEALLEEMPADSLTKIDPARVVAVRPAHRFGQGGRGGWHEHEMHMVGHQTPGPDLHAMPGRRLSQQGHIGLAIIFGMEDRQGTHAPLEDVVGRQPGSTTRARRAIVGSVERHVMTSAHCRA